MTRYSPSKLSTFENCPLSYKLQYEDRIKRDIDRIEGFLGKRVHESLEKLYTDLKHRKTNSLEELLAYYNQLWKKNWHDGVRITKQGYGPDNYYEMGVDCIASYYRRYHPFDQAKIVGIEKQLSGPLGDSQYQITGFADRIDQLGDGGYEIHDYKTSTYLPSQSDVDEDKQLALYHLMLKNDWDDVDKVTLVWHYLVFDKELCSMRTKEQLDELIQQTLGTIQSIERAVETNNFSARESALCNWCDYPDLCPKRKHFVQVEPLSAGQYLSDDGVKLVNDYAKWYDKKNEAELQLKKVKEAVATYAKKQGLELVKGSDHKLRVKTSTKVKFPGKSDKEREQLEQLLQDIGKWEEVSTLDTFALAKVIKKEQWDKGLLKEVRSHLREEEASSVSLSKLEKNEKERILVDF